LYIDIVFNIITRKTLLYYAVLYPEAKTALFTWYHEFQPLDLSSFNELKRKFGNASIVGDDRVVFNIMGNKFSKNSF